MCVCVWIFIPWFVAGSSVASFQNTTYHAKAVSSVVILGSFFDVGGSQLLLHFELSTEEVRRGPFGMFFQPSRRLHSSLV